MKELEDKRAALSKEIAELDKSIAAKKKIREKLWKEWDEVSKEINKSKEEDLLWLIRNPNEPGSYEMARELLFKRFGSEYTFYSTGGYFTNTGCKALNLYIDKLDDYLEKMKELVTIWVEASAVPLKEAADKELGHCVLFQFKVHESRGIQYLSWSYDKKAWYYVNVCYHRIETNELLGTDLEEALKLCKQRLFKESYDYDEDDSF